MSDKIFRIQSIVKKDNRVEAEILHLGKTSTIFFECDDPALIPSPEALLAILLIPAMQAGAELQVGSQVSRRIFDKLPVMQDIQHAWYPDYFHYIDITGTTPVEKHNAGAKRVGTFFSLGVDSWHTFLKHREEITDLIFVWGVDMYFEQTSLFEESKRNLQIVADAFQKNLVIVKTNMKDFTDPYTPYEKIFGSALGGIGHLLSSEFRKVYIAAPLTYRILYPEGSHILVDPLWSSESLEIIHDGKEATRLEKVRMVSQSDVAMRTLRVCTHNVGEAYNCGRCEKCLRTMVALHIVGALDRCSTFHNPIDIKQLTRQRYLNETTVIFHEENLAGLKSLPGNRALYKAERKVIAFYYFKDFLNKLRALYPGLRLGLGRFWKKIRRKKRYWDYR